MAATKKENSEASCQTCTCGCKRGQMKGKMILTSMEKLDKFDNNTIAVDCSDEELRLIEASLHQVLHRMTPNETEDSATNTGAERIRGMAFDREKI